MRFCFNINVFVYVPRQLRVKTMMGLLEEGFLDQVTIDADQSEKLVKLLDTVVIKLEGGTELDLQVLENPPVQPVVEKVSQLFSTNLGQ